MSTVTNPQFRMIYALAKKCGLDNESLHLKAAAMTGKESLKQLTLSEANGLIDVLKRECGQGEESVNDRATAAQRRMIYGLARSMGWMDNPKRLRGFLESRFHVSDVPFIPADKVNGVILALKTMQAKGYGERTKSSRNE